MLFVNRQRHAFIPPLKGVGFRLGICKTSRDPDLAPLYDRDDFRRLVNDLFDRGFPDDPFAREAPDRHHHSPSH